MRDQIEKLASEFVRAVLHTVASGTLEGLANLRGDLDASVEILQVRQGADWGFERRSTIAKKAALTRKRRKAARKAAETRLRNG